MGCGASSDNDGRERAYSQQQNNNSRRSSCETFVTDWVAPITDEVVSVDTALLDSHSSSSGNLLSPKGSVYGCMLLSPAGSFIQTPSQSFHSPTTPRESGNNSNLNQCSYLGAARSPQSSPILTRGERYPKNFVTSFGPSSPYRGSEPRESLEMSNQVNDLSVNAKANNNFAVNSDESAEDGHQCDEPSPTMESIKMTIRTAKASLSATFVHEMDALAEKKYAEMLYRGHNDPRSDPELCEHMTHMACRISMKERSRMDDWYSEIVPPVRRSQRDPRGQRAGVEDEHNASTTTTTTGGRCSSNTSIPKSESSYPDIPTCGHKGDVALASTSTDDEAHSSKRSRQRPTPIHTDV